MTPTVFLFDIDGTLLSTGGAGRRAMANAFLEHFGEGAHDALTFSFAGMTDHAIIREGIRRASGADDVATLTAVLRAYLGRLATEVDASSTYRIMPGVQDILAWLASIDDVAIGLGTGNVRDGAYTKLTRGGLDGAFAFGGFGCDAEDRAELLSVGAARGASALGARRDDCRVVVIGDTPRDVAAAQAIGAECIGVGTGGVAPEELVALGARWGFPDLACEGVREALLVAQVTRPGA